MGYEIGLDSGWIIETLYFAITDPLSSQITRASLCLIRVSLVIPIIANLRYACGPTLNMVVKKTSLIFTCK